MNTLKLIKKCDISMDEFNSKLKVYEKIPHFTQDDAKTMLKYDLDDASKNLKTFEDKMQQRFKQHTNNLRWDCTVGKVEI
jgi:DNA-binding MarR family transcriptional regulator